MKYFLNYIRRLLRTLFSKRYNLYDFILLILFGISLILITTFKISGDDDLFWHLETGRYIVETGTIPSTDVFGFATADEQWIPTGWSWDIIMYSMFNISGYLGISIFRTMIFLLVFLIYYKILAKLNVSKNIILLVLILLTFAIFDRLLPKPQNISYLFLVLLLSIIINFKYINRKNYRILYWLPLIFLIWANMHMGVLAGMGLLGIFLISEIIVYFFKDKFSSNEIAPLSKKDLLRLSAVSAITVISILINPHGFTKYSYVYSHLTVNMQNEITEWFSPFNQIYIDRFFTIIYFIFLGGAFLILYYASVKKDLFAVMLCLAFSVYSTQTIRYSIDFMIVMVVYLALSLDFFIMNLKSRIIKDLLLKSNELKIGILILLIVIISAIPDNRLYEFLNYRRVSGFGIDDYYYPANLFNFIEENEIQEIGERPFNSYECGGYFIWSFKDRKNFIDSRYLNDSLFNDFNIIDNKLPGFEKKIKEYDFDYIIWFYSDLLIELGSMKVSIVSYLINKPDEWKLIYWDDNSFLFVKNENKFKDIILKHEYKYVNPLNYVYQREILMRALADSKEEVFNEIRRKMEYEPEGIFIRAIAKSLKFQGD
ncbi:MAG: hypothetical protein ACRDFC_04770 [Ignavibacteria bacterium]